MIRDRKEIRRDCRRYYFLPVLLGGLSRMTGKILTIYSMAVLGKFADEIFSESQRGSVFPTCGRFWAASWLRF
ncbi:MAG: hypothetical protein ACLSHW_11140 [Lachnospiraceae bacterium]